MRNSRIFIGSSGKQSKTALKLKVSLEATADVSFWGTAFESGDITLDKVLDLSKSHDFGIFIFGPDDFLIKHGKKQRAVRDNVLFETGVFMGVLGKKRTMILVPKSANRILSWPSDLDGLTTLRYPSRKNGAPYSPRSLDQLTEQIKHLVLKEGPLPRITHDELFSLRDRISLIEFRVGNGKKEYSLSKIVNEAANNRRRPWHTGVEPMWFMEKIRSKYSNSVTDTVYWWLVVTGVLEFKDIEQFTSEESWDWAESIEYVSISERGAALLNLLQAI